MSANDIAKENVKSASRFGRYMAEHPEVLEGIPQESHFVFFSSNHYINLYNEKLGKDLIKNGERNVYKIVPNNKGYEIESLVKETV